MKSSRQMSSMFAASIACVLATGACVAGDNDNAPPTDFSGVRAVGDIGTLPGDNTVKYTVRITRSIRAQVGNKISVNVVETGADHNVALPTCVRLPQGCIVDLLNTEPLQVTNALQGQLLREAELGPVTVSGYFDTSDVGASSFVVTGALITATAE
jgi:hypothetical protein